MTIDEFWKLLDRLPIEGADDELKSRLEKLEPEAIAAYHAHFCRMVFQAYDWELWAAAYIIEGGCSDDGFTDFRYGLISRGRKVYEAALANPDSLADLGTGPEEEFVSNESFGSVAREVYESKTGKPIPDDENLRHPEQPTGENWDLDDEVLCAKKLQKVWARFGGS